MNQGFVKKQKKKKHTTSIIYQNRSLDINTDNNLLWFKLLNMGVFVWI